MKVEISTFIIASYVIFYLISTVSLKPLYERYDPKSFPFKQNRKKAIFNLLWLNLVFSGCIYFILYGILSWHLPKVIIIDNNESVVEYLLISDESNDNFKASFDRFYIKNECLRPIYVIKVDYSKEIKQNGRIELVRQIKPNESFCISKKPYSEMEMVPDYIYRKVRKFEGCHTFIVSESEYNRLLESNDKYKRWSVAIYVPAKRLYPTTASSERGRTSRASLPEEYYSHDPKSPRPVTRILKYDNRNRIVLFND